MRFAGPVLGVVVSLAVSAVISQFASWFDGLSASQLFLVVFGIVGAIWFGTEWFYLREYNRDYVSADHLAALKKTAAEISMRVTSKYSTKDYSAKDQRDLFSHRRLLKRECKRWNEACDARDAARWKYQTTLAAMLDEAGFREPRFSRNQILSLVETLNGERETEEQLRPGSRKRFNWVWDVSPMDLDAGMRHDLLIRYGQGVLFIRDFDSVDDPIDVEACKGRLQDIFEKLDGGPEIVEWVKRNQVLAKSGLSDGFADALDEFRRLDRMRHGRSCNQCNS